MQGCFTLLYSCSKNECNNHFWFFFFCILYTHAPHLIYSYDFILIFTASDCGDLQVRLDISIQMSKKTEQTSDEKWEIYQNLSTHGSLKASFENA